MPGELNDDTSVDAMLDRARLAQPVRVVVEEYRLGRFMVIHASACRCPIHPARRSRRLHYLETRSLPEVLLEVWPHDFLGPQGYDATLRTLASRSCLGACQPQLIVPPTLAPLMRQEPPVAEIPVMVCPDATGKQIVHAPHCQHAARLRASKDGTGKEFCVDSLHTLVPLVLPDFPGGVDTAADSEFEVRDCVRNLPTVPPTPVPLATKLQVARKRAYSALVALYSTAQTVDAERARDAHMRLEQRVAAPERRRASANLQVHDVRDHLVAASEAAAWLGVRREAEEPDAAPGLWETLDDQGKADRWVKAAMRARAMYRNRREGGAEQGGTDMGKAFKDAAETGVTQFLNAVNQALHEVDDLREKAADAAG